MSGPLPGLTGTFPLPGGAAGDGEDAFVRGAGRVFLVAMYAALRSLKLYPLENATVQKSLDDLEAAAVQLQRDGEIDVKLAGDFLYVNGTRLRLELDNYTSFSMVLAQLRALGIGTLHVAPGVTRKEWQAVLSILLALQGKGEPDALFDQLRERVEAAGVGAIAFAPRTEGGEGFADEGQKSSKEVAKRTYSQGVAVTREVMGQARLGRAGGLRKVKRAVQLIVDQVLNNETSIVGLTAIRDYDEYTFTHSVNVCIFSVALGKKLGLSKLQLYDLGMAALLHDMGKSRIPLEVLNKTGGLDEREWRLMQAHTWQGALALFQMRGFEDIPWRSILAAHEHHMKRDRSGYPRSVRHRELGLFTRIVSVADGYDAATTRRAYQTVPIEPDQVLREMWENPHRGYEPVLVKALINLIGIYPVGTCVILDGMEVAIVTGPNPEAPLNRPNVRIAIDAQGALVPPPGMETSLADKLPGGAWRRSIIKVTNPQKYGLTVGDYFI
ncbi:MAG: HD domain-containing protein [Gemmatimonadales bacterium]|nr:HD domain-containing protein [Gemmatimonadales bacterium]